METSGYKNLVVWQKSVDLVEEIFRNTAKFPKSELYGLVSQIRRAAVAIASNIAEGAGRQYKKEFVQFLYIARGSAKELETQIIISRRLDYIPQLDYERLTDALNEIQKMLVKLCQSLSTTN